MKPEDGVHLVDEFVVFGRSLGGICVKYIYETHMRETQIRNIYETHVCNIYIYIISILYKKIYIYVKNIFETVYV